MKLYLLRPATNILKNSPWDPWYNKAFGFVVCADNETDARMLATAQAGDEVHYNPTAWTDPRLSTCVELTADSPAGVIARDFHAT